VVGMMMGNKNGLQPQLMRLQPCIDHGRIAGINNQGMAV
jgi:hypothetical protein